MSFSKPMMKTAAALAASALFLTACGGGGSGGGDSDDPIKLGAIMDQSGATGDVGAAYADGVKAYVEHINEEGGVEGRKFDLHLNDYAYEIPKAEELYRKYVSDEVVAIQGWGTGDTEALRTKVANDELPFMSASYAEELTDPEQSPFNFVVAATYSDQMRVALDYVNKEKPDATVAVLYHDSPFGMAPVGDGEEWIKEKGYSIKYSATPVPAGTTNFAGLLSQVKDADYIIVQNVASPAAALARDIKAQGAKQKQINLNWGSNEIFIKGAGDAAGENQILITPIAPLANEKPGHKPIREYMEKNGLKEEQVVVGWVQGWYTMHVMAEGIRKVIQDGGDVDGPAIREALETMGPIDTGGVMGDGTVEFSKESHRGSTASSIYTVKDGKMSVIEDGVNP